MIINLLDDMTVDGCGDSFFEYLLKQYLLTKKTEPKYLNMCKLYLSIFDERDEELTEAT